MAITDLFIRRPILALVINTLILLVGIAALRGLPIRQFPLMENATITVTTNFPGGTAETMQGFVTTPIAQAISTASGIEYLQSSSTPGVSLITARLRLNADSNQAMTEIMAKLNEVKYKLPREANDPVIEKTTGDPTAITYVGFSSEQLSLAQINDYVARTVQPVISAIPGVAQAQLAGGQSLAMRIWLDPQRMAARNLSADQIAEAIRRNNFQAAPGQVRGAFVISNIRAETDLISVEEFKQMVVRADGDTLVRLQDVATVELGAQSYDQSGLMDNKRAIYIAVNATPTGNPLEIVRAIREKIPDIRRNLPPTLKVEVNFDVASFVQAAIDEVRKTLIESVAIVVLLIFLFLGSFRSVLIPVVTIPLSLIGTAALMLMLGFSINLLTLLAMVMAIGLVVDDAIVVVENVHRHMEEGLSPMEAALQGAREIVGPVIAMTLTLAAVYTPIGIMGGLTGALFKEFALSLAGAVIVSGVIALTLSPVMCALLLKRESLSGPFARRVDHLFSRIAEGYARRLNNSLHYRPVTLLLAVAVIASLWFLYTGSRSELAPPEDQGTILISGKGPRSANLEYTEAYMHKVTALMDNLPEAFSSFGINGNDGLSNSFGGVIFKRWDQRERSSQQILPDLQNQLNGVEGQNVFAFLLPSLPGSTGGLPVQMVINSAEPYSVVFDTMEKLKDAARKSGMFMVVDSDLAFDNPTARVIIDRSKANALGVDMQKIGDTLTLLVGGNYINRFNLDGRSYDVIMQVPRAYRFSPEALGQYYVETASGQQVPLATVVRIENTIEPNALTQFAQLNSATFMAMPTPGVTMGDAVAFLQAQAKQILPDGFTYDWLSDSRQYVQEGNRLIATFGIAIVVIFLVLAAQFDSLRDPLIILVTVPLSVFGALLPIFLGFVTLNIYTQIGLVTLIGLISKHGILMVDFANKLQQEQQLDKFAAIVKSAQVRLRPILMTTAAMVVGLIPLLLASGAGADSRFNIGLVIVCGMSVGTAFTLFVLPVFYTLLARDHRALAQEAAASQAADLPAH
jgi:multidrug efflux pump